MKKKAIFNWSGGKDSALALYKILQQQEFDIAGLLTTVNEHFNRISMHGVRKELLEKQAAAIHIPLHEILLPEMPSMETYNTAMEEVLNDFNSRGINYAIFGDIFLEDLRAYREEQLKKAGIQPVFPIWKMPTDKLLHEFIASGFKAIIVCVNEKYLDRSFAGRFIDEDFINDLPDGVDPCGENGEYHSFVFDGPIFQAPVPFSIGEVVYKQFAPAADDDGTTPFDTGFYYCDLLPLS